MTNSNPTDGSGLAITCTKCTEVKITNSTFEDFVGNKGAVMNFDGSCGVVLTETKIQNNVAN